MNAALFALALAASSPPAEPSALPAGSVVLGVSTIDGTATEITALLPDGGQRLLAEEAHDRGIVPKGTLTRDGRLVLAVQPRGAEGASVVVLDLASGARRVEGQRAIASQAPLVVEDAGGEAVVFVRAHETPARSTFDVVRARGGQAEVIASTDAAWLAPVATSSVPADRFLRIEPSGAASVVHVDKDALVKDIDVGKGPVRLPLLVPSSEGGGRVLVERVLPDASEVVDATTGAVVARGLGELRPLALGDGRVVVGAGTKRAGVRVLRLDARGRVQKDELLPSERAGVATPLAAALVDGRPVVVAWLNRGQALPGELWLFTSGSARALLPARAGVAVEVYGVVTSGGAT